MLIVVGLSELAQTVDVGRRDKEQIGCTERLVMSKPTWWDTLGVFCHGGFYF